ncbi:MAG: class I SAM-dependent methyltransferase, partial [Planctomycetota bacterium]
MTFPRHLTLLVALLAAVGCSTAPATPPTPPTAAPTAVSVLTDRQSTRIESAAQTARTTSGSYAYREYADTLIQRELDIRPGDAVLDIGAGDGWWAERFAAQVGDGIVYALEVDQEKVDKLKEKFAADAHVRPFLGETDSTTLHTDSCSLAFFSQVYHHLDEGGHTAYLKHLRDVVTPTGRLVVIEKYTGIDVGRGDHGTKLSDLLAQAEDAGWAPMRVELMPKTYHFIAIFGQKEMFPLEPGRDQQAVSDLLAKVGLSKSAPITPSSDWQSTRIESAAQTARKENTRYPHRAFADTLIKRELDLKADDTVIDIGAG